MRLLTGKKLGWLAAAGLSIFLLLVTFWVVDPQHVWRDMEQFPLWSIALIIMILLMNLGVVIARLSRMLHHFGISLPSGVAFKATVSGHFAGLFIISIFGQVVGRFLVLRRYGLSSVVLATLAAYERFILVLITGSLSFVSALFLIGRGDVYDFLGHISLLEVAIVSVSGLVLSLLLGAARYEINLLHKLRSLVNLTRFLEISLFTLFSQALVLLSYMAAILSLNSELDVISVLAASAIISFAASMPISVNGWGVRELTAIYVFGYLGVPSSSALAVSILIGVLSTVVILMAAPFAIRKPKPNEPVEPSALGNPLQIKTAFNLGELEKTAVWMFSLVAAVLVFFQVHVPLPTGTININLADPFAILALAVVVTQIALTGKLPKWRSSAFNAVLIAITILILIAYYHGVHDIGVTQWAFAGRVVGWLVILGYLSIGYLLITFCGFHALRRFAETMVATAVVIVVVQTTLRWLVSIGADPGVELTIVFEGYAANRNAFVLQLVLCSVMLMAFSLEYLRYDRQQCRKFPWLSKTTIYSFCHGVILLGIYYTGSLTGLIAGLLLLVVALRLNVTSQRFVIQSLLFGLAAWSLPYVYASLNSLVSPLNTAAFPSIGTHLSQSDSHVQRWATISKGFELWWEAPFFGSGLGVFFYNSPKWFAEPMVIHSTPVWLMAEFGAVGLVTFIFMFVVVVRQMLNNSMTLPGPRIVVLLMVVFALFSIPHEVFYQRVLWLVLGAGMAASAYQGYVNLGWPRKVCHLITGLGAGGAERMLTRLVSSPNQKGVQHTVISMMGSGVFGPEIEAKGVALHTLGMRRGMPSLFAIWRLIGLLRSLKPDVLMTWLYHADLLGIIVGRLTNVRRIYWNLRCSDMSRDNQSWISMVRTWFLVRLSPLPTEVLANSKAGQKHHLGMGYKPKAWRIIPNGVNLDQFTVSTHGPSYLRETLNLTSDALVVGHVARYAEMKDHVTLLAALADVARQVPHAHFVLVGHEVTDKTPFFAQVMQISVLRGRLHLLGRCQNIPQILSGLDLFVLSSAYGEGMPNVLLEAMASGVPCVTTDVGDAAAIVGDTGRVVRPEDPAALAHAIVQMLKLPSAQRRGVGVKAHERVKEHYALEASHQQYLDLFLAKD